jgi:hypothetical protein
MKIVKYPGRSQFMTGPASLARIPLKYHHTEQNLILLLVGFAASVLITRSFLELTGYPQIASGDFHIAHVLWGGLLLYLAAISLLIWRGRRIHSLGSLLTGIGFGLFIDEIGKFITRSNDYFYPLAAPLIYAFFLLSVLVYLWLRNRRSDDASNEAYRILDLLEGGIDPHVSAQEHAHLKDHLSQIANRSMHPRSVLLAEIALRFLDADPLTPHSSSPGFFERWMERLREAEARWIRHNRFKAALVIGFLLLSVRGLLAAVAIFILVVNVVAPSNWQQIVSTPWLDGYPIGAPRLVLFALVIFSEAAIGVLFLVVITLLMTGQEGIGIGLGYWVLLFSLTALHLPVFYFQQFEGIATTLLQFALLLGVVRYRSYLPDPRDPLPGRA